MYTNIINMIIITIIIILLFFRILFREHFYRITLTYISLCIQYLYTNISYNNYE